jgi:carboxymethylenebutenolidase
MVDMSAFGVGASGPTAPGAPSGAVPGDMTAATIGIRAADGTAIEAYLARPSSDHKRGGVVVIHHLPGYDRATKEIARRFAELGYDAICPNLYSRQAPGAAPDDAAALVRAQGGKPDAELVVDVAGAAAYLRSLPGSNGKVGVIGYCSGGRQAVLAGCTTEVDAVVDCYGAYVTGTPPEGWVINVTNLVAQLPDLRCPLLGLFGDEDQSPSPEHVDELSRRLTELGKRFELHSYSDAGHGFFAVHRPSYRPAAAEDGWLKIAAFFAHHLASTAGSTDVHL